MSTKDFQDRLHRIQAKSPQQQAMDQVPPHVRDAKPQKPDYRLVGAGGAVMALGMQTVKYANQNYEAVRDSSGIGAALGLGLGGLAVLVIGIILIMRGVSRKRATAEEAKPLRRAAGGARIFFSLLGFAFGAIACFYTILAVSARYIDTETAQIFSKGGIVIALSLACVSLLFGFLSLFLRGYALGRVPGYFVLGAVLTFSAFELGEVNVFKWESLMAELR